MKPLFNPNENPAFIDIHLDNIRTIVKISYSSTKNGLVFILSFYYNGRYFEKELEGVSDPNHYWSSKDIFFQDIPILDVDKTRIADSLDRIYDKYFQ